MIPRRGRLNVLLALAAFVVIAATVVLLIWSAPLARSGVGAEDANPNAGAGSAVIHDDGHHERYYPLPHGKVVPLKAGAGSAIVHDDAGNVNRDAGSAILHDDAGNVHPD
jgi:hypothetical protein